MTVAAYKELPLKIKQAVATVNGAIGVQVDVHNLHTE
jgi:hypothetical protein